jgi:hypothetical protein
MGAGMPDAVTEEQVRRQAAKRSAAAPLRGDETSRARAAPIEIER